MSAQHGDTRRCTRCQNELTYHAGLYTWEGDHHPGCQVGERIAANRGGLSTHPERTSADDERDPIGANGQPRWRVTVQLGAPGARFEDTFYVDSATEDGAILLGQESRLNVVGILAEPVP